MSIARRFRGTFGRAPDVVVRSPGRVNLIGEHTDYNEGWVLPVAIDLGTDIAAASRHDGVVRTVAERVDAEDVVALDDLDPTAGSGWSRYVRGMVALLPRLGVEPTGFDLLIGGDLPLGAGLSSSASLEMGVGLATCAVAGFEPNRTELARIGQKVENEIVGVQAGIMDQLAVACGRAGHALLIDCRSLETGHVPIPGDVRLLVLDSAVPRTLAGSAYNTRRRECEMAVEAVRDLEPRVTALRDVTLEQLDSVRPRLPEPVFRRARHVITENDRVSRAVDALRDNRLDELGRISADGHASLRDDFEVSCPEIEQLVSIAASTHGVRTARLTGAGFGGCVIALVDESEAIRAASSIVARYRAASGLEGRAFVCESTDGAAVVEGG